MITQGNILLAQGTSAQIETSARPNMFVHNTTDKSMVYSPDGVAKYRYDDRNHIAALISAAGANQSLNTTDNVAFNSLATNYIDFNTSTSADYQLGRLHWDSDDKTLDLDLDGGSVLQIGQETLIRGQNAEIDTITNGTVVYIGGAQGNRPKMYRADADAVGKSKVIAISTQDIPANQTGFFTAFGLVRDINTNAWNEGDELFLSTSAGLMTNVKPTTVDADVVSVGYVIRKHATVGSIFFNTNREVSVKDLPKTYQPWLGIYRDTSTLAYQGTLSYNQATRQVSLSAPTSAYPKNQYGQAITIPAGVICTHPNTTGSHYIYVDEDGVIQCSSTVWNLTSHCPIAFVYYNAGQARGICFEERHSHDRNAEAHKQQHLSIGTFCYPYPSFSGYTLAPSSPANTDNTWGTTSFTMYDEDIKVVTSAFVDGDSKSVLYKSGSVWAFAPDSIYATITSGTYLSYNPGGTLAELTNGEYTNYYVFGQTSISGASTQRLVSIPSQNKYSTLAAAETESLSQGLDIASLPIQEWVLLAKFTLRCAASYTTLGKYRIENIETFQNSRSGSVLGGTGISQTFADATYIRIDGVNYPYLIGTSANIQNQLGYISATKSDVGHIHDDRYYTESEINSLLSGKLDRVPTIITNLNANSYNDNGIYAGYSVTNAPNITWGILRVWSAPNDDGDQVWQEWRTASYGDQSVWKRGSFDFGATWTAWHRELDSNIDSALLANSHSHINKSQLDTIDQNLGTGNTVSFNQVIATNDGNGENFRVGNDAWIGDINQANTLRIKGVSDGNSGFIKFGYDSATLGFDSANGYMTYTGSMRFGPSSPFSPNANTKYVFNVGNNDHNGIGVYADRNDKSAFIWMGTQSNSNASWAIQKRDDGLYGTTVGCFTIEDSTATVGVPRFPLTIAAGDGGNILLNRNVNIYTGKRLSAKKDVQPTTAPNTNYANAPIIVSREATAGNTYAAGIGFLNENVNGAFLYYDPAQSVFKYNKDIASPLVTIWDTSNLNVTASHLTGTSANVQTQLDNLSASFTRNIISVASNTQLNATGRHLSATIPANTISQTVPTQVKVVGKIGANYVGGTATIEIEIAGNNIFTHTLTASGQNEDDIFEIDFGIRYAGSSTMECFGLCKIDNIVTTTQTPKMRYISAFFTGIPTNSYVFDVKSTITGTAGASVTLTKVTKG